MKKGYLSEYFEGVAVKRLSAVEANPERSNQHEFDGVQSLKRILGPCSERRTYTARFVYLKDADDQSIFTNGFLTWYDARERHPTRSECRLYFPSTPVTEMASEGDLLVICKKSDETLFVIIADAGSTVENQILWLFNFKDIKPDSFSLKDEDAGNRIKVEYAAKIILEQIGIEIEDTDESHLEQMLNIYKGAFPTTREFSEFARSTLEELPVIENPDNALLAWMEKEEILFRTLERHIVREKLLEGFGSNVDDFIKFSLSVQNRRKSRAGYALENHLENIFICHNVEYARNGVTENRSKPDFIFPGIAHYHDRNFPAINLTMLGVKSTCKERWRQVLAEADRIDNKHLLTLEPGISEFQTNDMHDKNLQLVVPTDILKTYTKQQASSLMNVKSFLDFVTERQRKSK